jgi:filamentous hemagglutinin family protein
MTTRIIFNGQEYASTEAMPQAVRTAYQEALAKLEDANENGVPGRLERGETGNVIMIQPSSITVNGREFKNVASMPAPLRVLYEYALRQAEGAQHGLSKTVAGDSGRVARALLPRAHSEDFLWAHSRAKHTAARVLPILLGLVTGGILIAGVWMVWHLDASLRSQGGDFYVGPGLLVAVALTGIAGICIAITMMLKKQGSPETSAPGGSAPDTQTTPSQARRNEGFLGALDTAEHTLARVLQILLGVAAGGVVAVGVWMISHMDPSSRSQAGDIFVGIGMLVALACIAGMYISIEMRLKK